MIKGTKEKYIVMFVFMWPQPLSPGLLMSDFLLNTNSWISLCAGVGEIHWRANCFSPIEDMRKTRVWNCCLKPCYKPLDFTVHWTLEELWEGSEMGRF